MVLSIYGQAKTGQIGCLQSLYDFKMASKTGLYIVDNIKIIPNNDAINAL